MLLMEQHLFRKVTGQRNYQWAQVNLHVDPVHGEFVLREYKGRSISSLQEKTRCVDTFERLARSNLFCKLERLERNGFVNQDRIIENMVDIPFSNFTPVPISYTNAAELYNRHDKANYALVPVPMGRHCMIRIGYTTAASIEAMLDDGSILKLPPAVEAGLLKLVKLGEVETIVLEAFVTQKWCQLTDLACVNGILRNESYKRRMARLKRYLPDERLYGEVVEVKNINTGTLNAIGEQKPKLYMVKNKTTGFFDILERGSHAIGQFYVAPAKLVLKSTRAQTRNNEYRYGINLYDENYRLTELGEVTVKTELNTSLAAKIMTSGFDGKGFKDIKVISCAEHVDFEDLNLGHWKNKPEQFWMANIKAPTILPVH